jgi:transcription factor C subunit 7
MPYIGLSEWYSPVAPGTGLHPRPGSNASLRVHFKEIDPEGWSSVWYPSRKGEDVDEVLERVYGFLEVFLPHIEARFPGKHDNILLVSHAATVIALARGLVGDRNLPVRIGCCSLSEFVPKHITVAERVVGHWKPLKLADGAHLLQGASRDWGFEDIEIADGKVCMNASLH